MIRFPIQKIRSLRWFILLAVILSALIVFIGVSAVSSLLYERLMSSQAEYLAEQLSRYPPGVLPEVDLPSVTTEVRITYILTFIFFSAFFLLGAILFSHRAMRRIQGSINQFNHQVRLIQSSQDLKSFDTGKLDFVFSELNQAFASINSMARQLEAVLVDKSALEIKADLLSKLIIKKSELSNWNAYAGEILQDIHQTLPLDFVLVVFEEPAPEIVIFWSGDPSPEQTRQVLALLEQPLSPETRLCHYPLQQQATTAGFQVNAALTAKLQLPQPSAGGITSLLIHSQALQDPVLQLSMHSVLMMLLNLLGASRAISGYTHQLEQAVSQSQQENAMAADILYGHLLVNNTEQLPGIHQQIRSSGNFSGDIILIKRSPSGSIFILAADATGHGLSATITIMPVINVFEAMVQKGHQLPFILSEMNKRLLKDLPDDRFVAATLVEVDPIHREVSLWNGAMPPALWLDETGQVIQQFASRHMALGILDGSLFESVPERFALPEQGHLLIYSDGLPEQINTKGESFGQQRLLNHLQRLTPETWVSDLINAVEIHSGCSHPDDDVSLCQINFAQLQGQPHHESIQEHLRRNLKAPFEWQAQISGDQLARQALPALCHEFMQTLGLSTQLRRRVFAIIHEITQKVLDINLLGLPEMQQDRDQSLGDYYRLKRQALESLNEGDFMRLSLVASLDANQQPRLIIEVRDNGRHAISLDAPATLPSIQALTSQIECLDQGHHIRISLE